MRIGLALPQDDAAAWAAAADAAGLFAVEVTGELGAVDAVPVIRATRHARVVVRVPLGAEHPITLAEELAVLDALSGGRIIALLDTGALRAGEAEEDVALVRAGLSSRPIRHAGARWTVPAGIHEDAPDAIMVTPAPVQYELPLWLEGAAAAAVGARLGVAVLDGAPADDAAYRPRAGRAALTGDLEADREIVVERAASGVSHLLVTLGSDATPERVSEYVGRFLIPEVGMVDFPRLMAESTPPLAWPGVLPLDV